VPGLSTLRSYRREWLARDTIAGLVLAAFLVPVGMGYAEASGLPAITGLYATIGILAALSVRQRDGRIGRNPRTGESVSVDAKRVPYFKPGKEMRERLNLKEVTAE